ncbi:MAG TPA: sulfurtransferase [Chromatiaceae bacterium]|nr:sulfurtransferase [Chromatiaceae bacterium]
MTNLKHCSRLLTGMLLLCLHNAIAATALPGHLVDAEWLSAHLDEVVILDVRKETESFAKEGHIEGAILVNVKKVRVKRDIDGVSLTRMRPDKKRFEQFIARHGVDSDSTVVITHRGQKPGNVAGAARLYWQFRYHGFDNVALLDGGNAAWVDALEDLSSDTPPVKTGRFHAGDRNDKLLATTPLVAQAVAGDNAYVPVDTRPLRFHIGLAQRDYVYAPGHLPRSRLFPYAFLHPEHGAMRFLPLAELKAAFADLDIDPQAPIITYCNSGYEASSVWFVLHELLGNPDARLYDGSLHEWTQDSSRPMTKRLFGQ